MKKTRIAPGLFLATFLVVPTCVSAQEAEEEPEQIRRGHDEIRSSRFRQAMSWGRDSRISP
jgi:hypothetical protein